MFWGFPQRLRLQRWLSENQAPGAQKAGAGGCFRALNAPREPIFWVRTHFSSQLWTNSVLTQTRIFRRVKDQLWLFWGPFWAPRASQRWRRNLWGKPQNISERSGWSGGVICRYFSSRNSWENLFFLKIEIFTICLLLPLCLYDPVEDGEIRGRFLIHKGGLRGIEGEQHKVWICTQMSQLFPHVYSHVLLAQIC